MTEDLPTTGRPVSLAQEQFWLQRKLYPDAALLAVPVMLRLKGPLDLRALGAAVGAVVQRHDVLSGWIEERGDEIVHIPAPWPAELDLLVLDSDGPIEESHELVPGELPDLLLPGDRLLAARVVRRAPDDHVLQLQIDHVVFDGASEQLLVDEIRTAYEAICAGRPAADTGPPLPSSYVDFAQWQREWVASDEGQAMLDACREALADAGELVLVTDRPRRAEMSFRGAGHYFEIGAGLTAQIRQFSAAHRVTPFMTLTAVFAVAMSRRADGNRDFLIGVPHLGRDHPDWAQLIGLFTNVVPTRVQLPPGQSFAELVRAIRAETVRAIGHSRIPFQNIVDAVRPVRDLTRVPLCPVTFQLRYDSLPAGRSGDIAVWQEPTYAPASEFELTLSVMDGETEFSASIEYATDLFDTSTIALIADEFRTLCTELTGHPDRAVELADHHGPRRAALLATGTGPAAASGSGLVHEEFTRQTQSTPDATAVVAANGELTYAELNAAADALADRLIAAGVRRGDRVAVTVARDLAMPIALLGVLKAGAAYLPLDLDVPGQRVATMISAGRPVAVVTDDTSAQLAAGHGLPAVPVSGPATATAVLPRLSPDDLAYVMFTSGTTGEPKAVAITHRGVTSMTARPAFAQVGPGKVVSQLAPAVFDPSANETWVALLSGSTLAISPTSRPSPAQLHEYVRHHQVRVLFLTTGLAQLVIDERLELFADIDHLLVGGDVLSPDHMHRVMTTYPRVRLTSFYGATETGIASTVTHNDLMRPGRPIPVGRPLPGREVYVLDNAGRTASPGVPGEIVLGGDGVAYGYLNQPGLTAQRFVPHPSRPGDRVYRTGDIGSLDATGILHFLGRSDRQVKIRGYRVEPAEVDVALGGHPSVRHSVTRPRRVAGDQILVSYVVTTDQMPDASLRRFLLGRLPEYCVPSRFLRLNTIPLTTNSKIDVAALDALDLPSPTAARPAGLTALETTVAAIWGEVLNLESVDPDADFFALGGHSLSAARIAARLERAIQQAVPVSVVFTTSTVRGLAGWLTDTEPDLANALVEPGYPEAEADEDVLAELIGASPEEVARVRDGLLG